MWEGTAGGLRPNLFVLPALGSDQVAQGFIESGLGNLQGWRQHSLSGHTVSVLNCPPHSGNVFLIASLNFPSSSLCPVSVVFPSCTFVYSLTLPSPYPPFRY